MFIFINRKLFTILFILLLFHANYTNIIGYLLT